VHFDASLHWDFCQVAAKKDTIYFVFHLSPVTLLVTISEYGEPPPSARRWTVGLHYLHDLYPNLRSNLIFSLLPQDVPWQMRKIPDPGQTEKRRVGKGSQAVSSEGFSKHVLPECEMGLTRGVKPAPTLSYSRGSLTTLLLVRNVQVHALEP
jgi:hypothetical protein